MLLTRNCSITTLTITQKCEGHALTKLPSGDDICEELVASLFPVVHRRSESEFILCFGRIYVHVACGGVGQSANGQRVHQYTQLLQRTRIS